MYPDHFTSLTNANRGDVSVADRKAYIKAVQCLINAPSKLPAGKFPGAHTRYEDFVVTHMQQTMQIHGTVRVLFIPVEDITDCV